ncbi:PPOX class F420-dependent oxidoreductase [Streptacidiphilus sp. P02-A3a]|uniref:PPOX class F420-dependent oxidoreductase n=1 Tax=Streptacidiphilus sp. P02-A3a TaxID=2704468 RepID=UPI001CDD79E0|nr:PPOX class F420-dependent oxidoreductase [Streptacidiphilus sp. P02-A3a]
MNETEWRAFLSEGTRTAKLATTRADGRPHVAPVWFLLDDTDLVFNTGKDTIKGKSLLRDGRVSICVDDERPPFAFALVEGRAIVSEELSEVREWATRIAARYVGPELAASYGERNGVPGELLVRVRIAKITAVADLSA